MIRRLDDIKAIRIEDYDYPLPDERIAAHPLSQRDSCRLLVRRTTGEIVDSRFSRLSDFLSEKSLIVFNNTRVINARLRFRKGEKHDGATIEIFCLEPESPRDYALNFTSSGPVEWTCFVGNSKRWKEGSLSMPLNVAGKRIVLSAHRVSQQGNASVVEFSWSVESDADRSHSVTFSDIISAAGEIPIPPYLNRPTEESDADDYQTVYSDVNGSVAAPTAGLHFTDELLRRLKADGHQLENVTLHVGAGTFQPVKSDAIGEHLMHSEFISVSRTVIADIASTSRKVTAVGTTSVRTLESLYHIGCLIHDGEWDGEVPQWYPYSDNHPRLSRREAFAEIEKYLDEARSENLVGQTRIIIAPGYEFKVVDAMVTNFHQPRSTLLLLVSAFLGDDAWKEVYSHAITEGDYRFLSYGDACLFFKRGQH